MRTEKGKGNRCEETYLVVSVECVQDLCIKPLLISGVLGTPQDPVEATLQTLIIEGVE
jgi:hypothetical protein